MRFTSTAPGRHPHLDSISVVAVPSPATFGLLGLGLVAFGFCRL
ncbi:MAG: PEP-CTERM sorting domain-containing protein [Chromatiales bacterium]|nr:PEP-CTERM sorting domain-containing protein [Chromatiales bacterium]